MLNDQDDIFPTYRTIEDTETESDSEIELEKFLNNFRSSFLKPECFICNGYYGPCFDDPICSACHAFLYPNTAPSYGNTTMLKNSDDSDSGNDEPVDNNQEQVEPIRHDPFFVPVRVNSLSMELQRLSTTTFDITDINIELFPPEVLMHMFQYLDEITLWSIGQVCNRWREILLLFVKQDRWFNFVKLRWPLFPWEFYNGDDYYKLYTLMMTSSNCIKCIRQMAAQEEPRDFEENSWRRIRLRTEIKSLRCDPLDGIEAIPLDSQCCHWQATLEGPAGSPYEGGLFFLYVQVPMTYPLQPPVVRFITKIFHPNISRHGDIGIDTIQDNWSLALTISKLLISIQSLLTDPYCDICMEPEIGYLYLRNREAFNEQAKKWTMLYAMHDVYVQ